MARLRNYCLKMNRYVFEKSLARGTGTALSLCRVGYSGGELVVVKELVDKDNLDNMEKELEVLRVIASHPSVIYLRDSFIFKEFGYLVYDYYPEGDLFHYIKKNGPLTEVEALLLLKQLTSALLHARNHGFFHCDVKPENVLLKSRVEFFLSDWDLARSSDQRKISMHHGSNLGMPPEVILGQLHENSDVYSLGCLMHYCLFGNRVYGLSSSDLPHKKIISHLEMPYEIPPGNYGGNLRILLERMLIKNPDQRATLTDIDSYFSGAIRHCATSSQSLDIYDVVPTVIDSEHATACKQKSLKRIMKHQEDADDRSKSLVLAHRVVLSYLRDTDSQLELAYEYQSNPTLIEASNRGDVWESRAQPFIT